ncbi:hypothetical protein [Hoeflea sp.]|uniref:hypothetical protein n=1 Tax=Hoeflea sp. TaxID=1940281 RepID=UPI0019949437|nr:hypothetical protein [Hoeflea sp.]MBC7284487.1 hypothetical protein [Hoeflea sp.]
MDLSRRLRNLLADYLAGSSTLREIENEFDAADVPFVPATGQNTGGQRRTLLAGYYNGLDFSDPADIRKFLNVLAVFMASIERSIPEPSPWSEDDTPHPFQQTFDNFQQQLGRDG